MSISLLLRWMRALSTAVLMALALGLAGGSAAHAGTMTLGPGFRHVVAAPLTEVLEDPGGQLTEAEARASGDRWRPWTSDSLVFGFTRSVFWVRWTMDNATGQPLRAVIDLGSSRQDHVRWIVRRNTGAPDIDTATGDRVPFTQRPGPARDFVLLVDLAPRERVDVMVRLQSHDGLFEPMPLAVHERIEFLRRTDVMTLMVTLFHGGMLMLAAYNLLLFVATRERAFGFYVLYLLSFLGWSFTFNGYAFQYFWPRSPTFNNEVLHTLVACLFASSGAFAIAYLRLHTVAPRPLLRWNQAMVALNVAVLVALPALNDRYAVAAGITMVCGLMLALSTLGTALWLLPRGSRQARFYVIAYAMLTFGALAYILQIARLVPTNAFSTWGLPVGAALEMLLLALGLADSLNTLKAEKLLAERQAREAQEALTQRLEREVGERTQALEQANRRLSALAITDELTGAFNRRHFNAFCVEVLADDARGEPIALCMFDIDHFKAYNDRLGHQAGDDTLRDVSLAVQHALRRSGDVLFRLGGEEFGVLFTAGSPGAAHQFVEQLRTAVEALATPHPGRGGVVTASFGVAWWPHSQRATLTPDEMYASADALLYEAKAAGRNTVAVGSPPPGAAP